MEDYKLIDNLVWDISKIFKYGNKYQKGIDHEIYYSDCELLTDFGPYKKGYKCDIVVDTGTCGDFSMRVDVDYSDYYNPKNGKLFVPVWTYIADSDNE